MSFQTNNYQKIFGQTLLAKRAFIFIAIFSLIISGFSKSSWIPFNHKQGTFPTALSCGHFSVVQNSVNPGCRLTVSIPGTKESLDKNGSTSKLSFATEDIRVIEYHATGHENPHLTGKPDLPFIRLQIRIPYSVTKFDISAKPAPFATVARSVNIGPVAFDPIATLRHQQDRSVYTKNSFYSPPIEYETALCHGNKFLEIRYCPLQYNPVTKALRATGQVEFKVTYLDGTLNERVDKNLFSAPLTSQSFNGITGRPLAPKLPSLKRNGKVVVVSKPALTNTETFRRWQEYRKAQGYTFIKTIDATNMSSEAITQELQNLYNTHRINFVLVIGDETIVPCPFVSGSRYHYKDWARLEGTDEYEDALLGILLCNTEEQFKNIVNHQIAHEQGGHWEKRVLVAAAEGQIQQVTHYSQQLDDPSNNLGYNVRRVFKVREIPPDYLNIDFPAWVIADKPFYIPNQDAQNALLKNWNSGVSLFCYRGAGSIGGSSSPSFRATFFSDSITSNSAPYTFMCGCLTGNFLGNHETNFAYQSQVNTFGTCATLAPTTVTYSGDNDKFAMGLWTAFMPNPPNYPGERNLGLLFNMAHRKSASHSRTYFHTFGDVLTNLNTGQNSCIMKPLEAFTKSIIIQDGSRICYTLNNKRSSKVRITLYSVQGRVIKDLINDSQTQGSYQIPLPKVAKGVYLCSMKYNGTQETIKIAIKK